MLSDTSSPANKEILMTFPSFTEYFEDICRNSTGPAFRFAGENGETAVSRSEFRHDVLSIADSVRKEYGGGNRIVLLGENSYEWILFFFAVVLSGNTAVLLDKDGTSETNSQRLTASECCTVLCSGLYSEEGLRLSENAKTFSSVARSETELSPAEIRPNDIIAVLFTSGTTGASKAVPLSGENIVSDSVSGSSLTDLTGTNLLVLPLHHGYGLVSAMLSPLHGGGTVYIGRGPRRLIADLALSRPDYLFAIPAMIKMFVAQLDRAGKGDDLRAVFGPNLKTIVCGSAPNPESMFLRFEKAGIELNCGYGITECSPMVSANETGHVHPESVGIPLSCNSVRISDEGEVLVKGSNVFRGYMNNEKATRDAFTEDGWFRTGDIGRFGPDGELYITGRIKNLIILSNGENISPEPMENAIGSLPYVDEVMVCEKDDLITAVCCLNSPCEDKLREEIKKLNGALPSSWMIRQVIVSPEPLPKTSTGKIKRS